MIGFVPVTEKDTEALVSLWEECHLTRPWNDPREDIRRMAGQPQSEIFVLHEGNSLIASVMVGHEGRRAWVYYLAVTPTHRGKGIGHAALKHAESWAKSKGLPKIHLMIRSENESTIPFYEGAGFEAGKIILMQKWLRPDDE